MPQEMLIWLPFATFLRQSESTVLKWPHTTQSKQGNKIKLLGCAGHAFSRRGAAQAACRLFHPV
jgi:hypothetical protein